MTFEALVGSGGWVAVIAVVAFVAKQAWDSYLQKRRTDLDIEGAEREELTLGVGNATTVNAIMTKSIEALHSENQRLIARNVALEEQIAERDARIADLKAQAVELSRQASELAAQIDTYQRLLSSQEKKAGGEEA